MSSRKIPPLGKRLAELDRKFLDKPLTDEEIHEYAVLSHQHLEEDGEVYSLELIEKGIREAQERMG